MLSQMPNAVTDADCCKRCKMLFQMPNAYTDAKCLYRCQMLLQMQNEVTDAELQPQSISCKLDGDYNNTPTLLKKNTCQGFNYHADSSRCEMYTIVGCKIFDNLTGWRYGCIETDQQRNTTIRNINIALNKPTYQSSTYDGIAFNEPAGLAEKAVDGIRNTLYGDGSCSHTTPEPKTWWIVDLRESYRINQIIIWNRLNYEFRLHDFSIDTACLFDGVNPDNTNWCRQHLQVGTLNDNPTAIALPPSAVGRFVKIQMDEQGVLVLCEFEVYVEYAATCV
ncbi:unnamed protein product [Owenia fusiformis]|uniref:Fucolectin tachylectin-4 pentraxin-1 domain-containing protein n=1 Tax=Owenia fusiformis TaxID=6347 RepID=A0A8S4QA65_OWEFU|nr:unnamed protein product [Owenia fusiformis]